MVTIGRGAARPSEQQRRTGMRLFLVSLLAGALAFGGTSVARAEFANLWATQDQNVVVHHTNPRYNANTQNYVKWRPTSNDCNWEMVVAVRHVNGTQIVRGATDVFNMGRWVLMKRDNGNAAVAKGTFYLNSRMTNFSGNGQYRGPCTWTGELQYSLSAP